MCFASINYALISISCTASYKIDESLNPQVLVFVLNGFLVLYNCVVLCRYDAKNIVYGCITERELFPLIFKVVGGGVSTTIYMICLKYIPLSVASIIYNMNPVFTTIIALTCIKEKVNWVDITNVICSFLGLTFIVYG